MKNHVACVSVLSGLFALTGWSAELSSDLKVGLSLWLDAGKNVDLTTAKIWCDVRESSAAASPRAYSCARATADVTTKVTLAAPTLSTDAGKPCVDFGLYGNYGGENKWMYVADANGALKTLTSKSLFCVVSFGKADNFGTVFGQIPSLTSNSGVSGVYYNKAQPGGEGGAIARSTDCFQNGETRLNGKRINPETATYLFDGRQVFSQVGPGKLASGTAPVFNTFFNDRNQGTITLGGGRLSEVLVYDRVLTDAERAAIEAYLSEKWLGAAIVPTVTSASGKALDATTLSGKKDTVALAEGHTMLSLPTVEGAMDEPPAPYMAGTNIVTAGGFESPAQTDNAYTIVTPDGWTKVAGTAYVGTPGSGIYNPSGAKVPEGRQFVALQGATIQQTVNVPADGLYKLTFYMTHRNGRGEGEGTMGVKVTVDGVQAYYGRVATDSRGSMDVFKYYTAELPPLAKGNHTLQIALVNLSGKDVMLICDDVRLTPLAAGEFVSIPNAGFESAGYVPFDTTNGGDAVVQGNNFTTDIFSWEAPVFSVGGKSCHARIAQNSPYFYWDYNGAKLAYTGEPKDERDYRKLVLARAGFARQTITIPRPGRLRFSMRYSRGYIGAGGHTVGVMLGETKVAETPAVTDALTTKSVVSEFDWSASGVSTLTVTNILPQIGDYYSIVDDLRLEYVDNLITDGMQADGSVAPVTLAGGETFEKTLNVGAAGFYYAALKVSGLLVEPDSASGVYNSYKYYPAHADVLVDGKTVASLTVESPDVKRLGVRLPYQPAGAHTVKVVGVADAVATQGKVRLVRAELSSLALDETAQPDLGEIKFALSEGATLGLDFPGTLRVRGLKINGTGFTGEVGASASAALSGPGVLDVHPNGLMILVR